ncbi:MAG: toxin-antitoxin system HicB family antitoxin [Paucibacter sp.]|nr:toxin-antitoxin system HicB family antitoxin [Roseateles sp.]
MASPDKKSFALRLDPALWAEIERLSAQELRSANAQIEYLLREALARRGIKPAVNSRPRGRPPRLDGDLDT